MSRMGSKMAGAVLMMVMLGKGGAEVKAPPTHPPHDILPLLTLDNAVPLEYYYVDDSNGGQGTHYKYSFADIGAMLSQALELVQTANTLTTPPPPPVSIHHTLRMSHLSDLWLLHALRHYPVAGKSVVIFGSTSPWYESIMLALNASHVTVVEYNHLTYDHPSITTTLLPSLPREKQFDVVLSLSSFDHDGLGRYGDPIDPEGDLKAMQVVDSVLKSEGIFILTVPIGPDVVVWNLHRRYGNLRLPLLLQGWEVEEVVGWREELLTVPAPYTIAYEPVFVLRKRRTQHNEL